MDKDSELSLEDAASHAVYAHNAQINKKGFSPRQIMFGKQKIAYRVLDPANTQPTRWNDHDNQRKAANRQNPEEIYKPIKVEDRMRKSMNRKRYRDSTLQYLEGNRDPNSENGSGLAISLKQEEAN